MEFLGEYLGKTDAITSTKEHPVSHIGYSYSAQVVELDENGKVAAVTAACDVGTVVNRQAVTGQIEGGVVMRVKRDGSIIVEQTDCICGLVNYRIYPHRPKSASKTPKRSNGCNKCKRENLFHFCFPFAGATADNFACFFGTHL